MLVLTQNIVERELEKKYSIRRIRNNIDLIGTTIIAIIEFEKDDSRELVYNAENRMLARCNKVTVLN